MAATVIARLVAPRELRKAMNDNSTKSSVKVQHCVRFTRYDVRKTVHQAFFLHCGRNPDTFLSGLCHFFYRLVFVRFRTAPQSKHLRACVPQKPLFRSGTPIAHCCVGRQESEQQNLAE